MTLQIALVLGLLFATVLLFASERLRLDIVALLLLLALMLTGILTPAEALAGFSDPVVLMIAGLFIVGGGLTHTGLAAAMGRLLARAGRHGGEAGLVVLVMLSVAALSAFMSTAGATAIFLPVVVNLAWRARVSPSKLLMPLAFGSLIGGMLTLIGTPPNLVVSGQLSTHGLKPFGFFDFTPIGLVLLVIGVSFMALVGRRMLSDRSRHSFALARSEEETLSLTDLAAAYHLPGQLFRVRIRRNSPLAGRTVAEVDLRGRYQVNVLELQNWPDGQVHPSPAHPVLPETVLRVNDILHIQATSEEVSQMARQEALGVLPIRDLDRPLISEELGMVEILLPPRSSLIGKTLREIRFRERYSVTVLSILRFGEPLREELGGARLRFGDTLLVQGSWEKIGVLREESRDFVVVGQPHEMLESPGSAHQRAPMAAAIMLVMLLLMTFEVIPGVAAVLLAAVAMILTRCLTMEEAYGEMNWASVVLLAGTLPLATALQKTGAVQFLAAGLTQSLGEWGPLAILGGFFVLTSVCSQFISNTATTVLMAPIAYQVATQLGFSPYPYLMVVALAASTSFSTPIASMSNTLVLGPGGYRFTDFLKVGVILQLLMLVAGLIVVPFFFPFR